MMKLNAAAIACAILLGLRHSTALAQFEKSSDFSEEVQKAVMESVVRMTVRTDSGGKQGSGVCVYHSDGIAAILTAGHVLKDAKSLTFEVFTRQSYPRPARTTSVACSTYWNEGDDIGLVMAKVWVPRKVTVAPLRTAIQPGDAVLSIGCGFGAPPAAQVAHLDSIVAGDYVVDRGAVGGRSGGPLFTHQGLIGIASRGRNDRTTYVGLEKIYGLITRAADRNRN